LNISNEITIVEYLFYSTFTCSRAVYHVADTAVM